MSKGNAFASDLLALIFHGTAIADLAENDSTSPATNLYISLHTADPGEAGTAATSETSYTNYARQAVARSTAGWTLATGDPDPASISPAADVDFPECGATPGAALTHFGVTTAVSGATILLYHGTLTPNITMATGVIPRVKSTSTITED